MESLLEWGLLGVVGAILLSAVGLPVPEELALATAGVLAGRGHAALVVSVGACYAVVLAADLLVWGIGRRIGSSERIVDMVGARRFARLSAAYERYGGWLILMVRPLPGLRVPVYSIAGAAGMPARRFLLFDGVAAAVTVPLYVTAGYWLADDVARLTEAIGQARTGAGTLALVIAAGALVWGRGALLRTRLARSSAPGD